MKQNIPYRYLRRHNSVLTQAFRAARRIWLRELFGGQEAHIAATMSVEATPMTIRLLMAIMKKLHLPYRGRSITGLFRVLSMNRARPQAVDIVGPQPN